MPHLLDDDIKSAFVACINAHDKSEAPLPYLVKPMFADEEHLQAAAQVVKQNFVHEKFGMMPVSFEMAKPNLNDTRFLHRPTLAEATEYHLHVRELARRSSSLRNDVSKSFRPNLTNSAEMWEDERKHPFKRWIQFQEAILDQCDRWPYCLITDIRKFFDNINHDRLREAIYSHYEDKFAGRQDVLYTVEHRLMALLNGWFPDRKRGLPQGPSASFLLSDIFLLSVDYAFDKPQFCLLRFADDIRIFWPFGNVSSK